MANDKKTPERLKLEAEALRLFREMHKNQRIADQLREQQKKPGKDDKKH